MLGTPFALNKRIYPITLKGKPTRGTHVRSKYQPKANYFFAKRRWCYHKAGTFVRNTPPLSIRGKINCVDNSNCRHFYILRQWHEAYANRNMIPCVVKRVSVLRFKSGEEAPAYQKLEPGDVKSAVILTRRSLSLRYSGIVTQFDKNAGILLDDKGAPMGTRIMYAASRHINHRFFLKAAVMANFLV